MLSGQGGAVSKLEVGGQRRAPVAILTYAAWRFTSVFARNMTAAA
jgi:hypothetical protein